MLTVIQGIILDKTTDSPTIMLTEKGGEYKKMILVLKILRIERRKHNAR